MSTISNTSDLYLILFLVIIWHLIHVFFILRLLLLMPLWYTLLMAPLYLSLKLVISLSLLCPFLTYFCFLTLLSISFLLANFVNLTMMFSFLTLVVVCRILEQDRFLGQNVGIVAYLLSLASMYPCLCLQLSLLHLLPPHPSIAGILALVMSLLVFFVLWFLTVNYDLSTMILLNVCFVNYQNNLLYLLIIVICMLVPLILFTLMFGTLPLTPPAVGPTILLSLLMINFALVGLICLKIDLNFIKFTQILRQWFTHNSLATSNISILIMMEYRDSFFHLLRQHGTLF